ncbi:MAG: class B sortase [bacterium]|nr:class B sortase [bacterium]
MKKKKNKGKMAIIIITTLLTIALIVLFLCLISKLLSGTKEYEIESRSEKITAYQKQKPEYDVDGWLRVQGTNIDYPVIFDNATTNINDIVDDFVWEREKSEELLNRTVILGHNIRNVSRNPIITDSTHTRFEQLMSFIYYDFAKENQYIQYTKNGKDYLYQIFSISFVQDDELIQTGYLSETEMQEYIEQSLKDSYFKYDVDIDKNDKIITLITCTRFFGSTTSYRFKIDGKLLADDEQARLSKVTIKDNYQEIENIMKGGELNEKQA